MDRTKLPIPPKGSTCASLLKKLSEENPGKQAFVFVDKDWKKTILTRKDVWDNCRKFAAILHRRGIKRGDIVCNTLVNSPERLITGLGTTVSGAISMNSENSLADGVELINNCHIAACKAIILDPFQVNGALTALQRKEYVDENSGEIRYADLPHLKTVINVNVCFSGNDNMKRGLQSIEEETEMYEEHDIEENEIAFVFNTSGTTGFSKLVPHTHKSCLLQGRMLGCLQGLQPERSRYFSDRSLGWLGGFAGPYLISGATHVLTDQSKGRPEMMDKHILKLLNEEEVDCGILLASDIGLLVQLIDSGEKLLRRLSAFGVTGMPLTKRISKAFGVITESINIGYGSTETGYVSIMHLKADTPYEDYCIGVAAQDFEIKVVDDESREVLAGQYGQVLLRGPTTTPGYLNQPEKTRKAFTKDGFLQVGDMAYRDENGLIYVLGRQADAIHKGIFIHYPGWLETRILKCLGVENVIVIGVPDPVNFEEICACVVPSDMEALTKQHLQEYCQGLFSADTHSEMSAMPKYFLFFESFPLSGNGKLDRKALRALACKRLNIDNS